MSYQNGYNGMPMQGGGGGYGGGYSGSSGGNFPPGMRPFNGGSPGFNNRGGGRGRGRRDDRGRGRGGHGGGGGDRHAPESTGVRFRKMVIKLGDEEDFDPVEDPPRLAKVLRRSWREGAPGVFDGFRIGVTQEPFKTPYYVALLLQLSIKPDSQFDVKEEEDAQTGEKRKAEDDGELDCGRDVLENLSIAYRTWVEGREWLNVRQCLHFFSLLLPAGVISGISLLELYKSHLSVLTELGGGGDRAERVIRAVGEGLLRSGQNLQAQFPEEVESIFSSLEAAILGRRGGKALNDPLCPILSEGQEAEPYQDSLGHLLAALHAFRSNDYSPPECLLRPWESVVIPEGHSLSEPYDLSAISMPPEMYDVNEDSLNGGEGQIGTIKFFAEDVVPSPDTPLGWTLRSIIHDTVHIFEVNRKECARLLLAIRQYLPKDTFKPLATTTETEDPSASTSTISLESLVVSTILSIMFTLPSPPYDLIYYGSVITELCKLSPNTVAPPVGRAVRKLFTMLGPEGLDSEISRRAAEWFAVHLSNFGFQWMWKEWIPDLALPSAHPRRAFIRKVVDSEVRLAYHDRILQTLPEPMQAKEAEVIGGDPQPNWPYERADHPLHQEATGLLDLLRKKGTNAEAQSYLVTLPNTTSGPDEPIPSNVRIMAIETILQLGSRSFSHFLNATERYLDLLRFLTPDPASRQLLLSGVSSYWKLSQQMQLITIDKYVQYGVLEGLDIVDWVFSEGEGTGAGADEADGWTDGHKWEILRMCLDKHSGRVASVKRRLRAVERADEAARARRAADVLEKGGDVGEEDIEVEDAQPERSNEARDAQTSLDINTTRLEKVLLATSKHFISTLLPEGDGGLRTVLKLLDAGEEGYWSTRAKYGWFREFVRRYQGYLEEMKSVVERDVLDKMGNERGEEMIKGLWSNIGQGE